MIKKIKEKKLVELEITGIAHKGMAVGRTEDGMVVFTKEAVPGDRVRVSLDKKRKGVWNGKTKEILRPSSHRVPAICQHFGICGGCSWQNLSYFEQLHQKESLVRDTLQRIAKVSLNQFEPILAAEKTVRYRNKLEFTFSPNRWLTNDEINSGETMEDILALGFHRPESFHKVVDIKTCWLQDIISDEIRNWTRAFFKNKELPFYQIKTHEGILRNLILRVNLKGEVMLILSAARETQDITEYFIDLAKQFPAIVCAFFVLNTKKNDTLFDLSYQKVFGTDYLIENLDHVNFKIGPKSFFQTNSSQTIQLYRLVEEYAELSGNEILYDLYCGVGSIGIFLARKLKKLIGVEEIPEAIADAQENAVLNQLHNTSFFAGDVKMVLSEDLMNQEGRPDVVILDPPRNGMHADALLYILQLKAPKIVYVSCNPATFARDLQTLEVDYRLIKVRPIDMFPHTNHVECVAQLVRK